MIAIALRPACWVILMSSLAGLPLMGQDVAVTTGEDTRCEDQPQPAVRTTVAATAPQAESGNCGNDLPLDGTARCVEINNSLINLNSNAMLFVTVNGNGNSNPYTGQFRVRYSNCSLGIWTVCSVSATDLTGAKFFVLAMTP